MEYYIQKYSIKMENNLQSVQGIVDYVSQLVSLNRRLQKKKVDIHTAKLAFTQLDTKRKGYLDLANVFELCGNVTEDELFYVFKLLDSSKTGDVTYDDFQWALVRNQTNQNTQNNNPIQSVKLTISTFLENFDYSQNLKRKLNITSQNLNKMYLSICQSQRKSSLTIQDLIYVFSHSKKWDNLCQQQLKNMFKQHKSISQKAFIQKFTPIKQIQPNNNNQETFSQGKTPQNQQNYSSYQNKVINHQILQNQCNQEQLLDDINSQYLASRNPNSSSKNNLHQNNVKEANQMPLNSNFKTEQLSYKTQYNRHQVKTAMDTNKITTEVSNKVSANNQMGDIQSMLRNIQKRREQLRKGSLQRKKLIQQALSRKKNIFPLGNNDNQSTNYEKNSFSRQNSHSKTSNSYSQVVLQDRYNHNYNITAQFGKNINSHNNQRTNNLNLNDRAQRNDLYIDQQRLYQTDINQKYYQPETRNTRTLQNFYSNGSGKFLANDFKLNENQWKSNIYKEQQKIRPQTPKFSQTAKQKFFQRPSSSLKVDRIAQIRQKINNLPQRNFQRNQREVDMIIQKYKHSKGESSHEVVSSHYQTRPNRQAYVSQQQQRNLIDPFFKNNSNLFGRENNSQSNCTVNLRNYDNRFELSCQRRQTPDSYLQEPKSRLNGSICSYKINSGSIQKQNLLKRAQQQAARKILQIERKAKMRVLQRKSAVGLKWIK